MQNENQVQSVFQTLVQPKKTEIDTSGARYIMAIDQGTSSTRVIIYDHDANIVASAQRKLTQYYPQAAWVEHDASEIWAGVREMMQESLLRAAAEWRDIAALGITNQRETVVIWDKVSGLPLAPAIVWQCRRTAEFCQSLKEGGKEELIRERTGLPVDAYFSASKLRWYFENMPDLRAKAERGEVLAGTVDSWLVWNLSAGYSHITDVSNASRTQLLNIHNLSWDEELLRLFSIPKKILPQVVRSSGEIAKFKVSVVDATQKSLNIPISGIAGDQQAALFGQCCFKPGMVKCTYGTGGFLLLNTGRKALRSEADLLTTIAWDVGDGPIYALEGSVFNAGSAIQWLRDELGLIPSAQACDAEALKAHDSGGAYFVPAFTGLGAPYWEMRAKGMLIGLSRSTNKAQLCRAVLESIAYQTADVCRAMQKDLGAALAELRVDGGVSNSDFMLQFQADLLNLPLLRPLSVETTALGAAFLAGLAVKFWKNSEELAQVWALGKRFEAGQDEAWREAALRGWDAAIQTVLFNADLKAGALAQAEGRHSSTGPGKK